MHYLRVQEHAKRHVERHVLWPHCLPRVLKRSRERISTSQEEAVLCLERHGFVTRIKCDDKGSRTCAMERQTVEENGASCLKVAKEVTGDRKDGFQSSGRAPRRSQNRSTMTDLDILLRSFFLMTRTFLSDELHCMIRKPVNNN